MRQLQLLVLIGSTKEHSSNQKLVAFVKKEAANLKMADSSDTAHLYWEIFPISKLPYFDPDLDKAPAGSLEKEAQQPAGTVPAAVEELRQKVAEADGILICTPEYVFSLPGVLKNALEWLVSTTVLTDKPMALITAAASGEKAKESLELIVKTLGGKFNTTTSIRVQGVAGKFNSEGELADAGTIQTLKDLLYNWFALMELKHPT